MKAKLQHQVSTVINDPNVPDYVKTMIQNYAGMMYYQQGILNMTMNGNKSNTLSLLVRELD